MTTPVFDPRRESWQEIISNRPEVMLTAAEVFKTHLVLFEREGGLPFLRIVDLASAAPTFLATSHRIEFAEPAYNASIGDNPEFDAVLGRIQNDLFDVEADLCMPSDQGKGHGGARLTVTAAQVEWLEQEIDRLNADLTPLRSFILPGGSTVSAYLHLARTVCRRGERLMAELNDKPGESVTPEALKYVNRLSDFLFVAGRFANEKGRSDVLWVPGKNR
jgi:cob(I)alamin adenosyltransferase